MDKHIWNFHLNEFCLAVTLIVSILSGDILLKGINLILFFINYNMLLVNIQVNRKRGTIILPILFSLLPKKIRNKLIENM